MRKLLLTLPLLVTVSCASTGGLDTSHISGAAVTGGVGGAGLGGAGAVRAGSTLGSTRVPYTGGVHPCEAGRGAVEAIENQEGIKIDCSRFETE